MQHCRAICWRENYLVTSGTVTTAPVQIKTGKLEPGVKGTILLDEITEMPMGVQANLMRVLQTKRFMRPGTFAAVEVDIRVLAVEYHEYGTRSL